MAESKEASESSVKQEVEELRRQNAVLQTENEMFESFLSRLDSLSMASPLVSQMEKWCRVHKGISESDKTSQEPPNLLTLEQKYYIAVSELEKTRKELEPFNMSLARTVKNYKGAIEDSGKRLGEIKQEKHEFEKFVAKIRQTTPDKAQRAQKVIGYIERKIKAKELLIDRIRRKNEFLRKQSWKQQRMVQQKEQMQDELRRIDLDYLRQKNIKSRRLLQDLQNELLCHRMLFRKTHQALIVYKEQLKKAVNESEVLSRKMSLHEEKLSKIRAIQQKVEKERAEAEALNKKQKADMANFRVPDVIEYIEAKVTNDRLRQTIKSLERKTRIAEMSSKTKKSVPGDSSGCSRSDDHTLHPFD